MAKVTVYVLACLHTLYVFTFALNGAMEVVSFCNFTYLEFVHVASSRLEFLQADRKFNQPVKQVGKDL